MTIEVIATHEPDVGMDAAGNIIELVLVEVDGVRQHMPVTELDFFHEWQIEADRGMFAGMVFIEGYRLKADGREVKRSTHVYKHRGVIGQGETGGVH